MTAPWKAMTVVAVLLAAVSILTGVLLYTTIQSQRSRALGLVCDQNRVLQDFIKAPPDRPRDAPALRRLRRENCEALVKDAEGLP